MKVADLMTRDLCIISPTTSIALAAQMMADNDIGVLPVVDRGSIVGILTDRDIALHAFVDGTHAGTPVLRIMSRNVQTCGTGDEIATVLARMAAQQVRRMPVRGEDGGLAGMVSIGDLAQCDEDEGEIAETLSAICRRTGHHTQQLNHA